MRNCCLVICCIAFVACTRSSAVPDDILPQKQMQAVMWDMMRADLFLTNYVFVKDTSLNKIQESQKMYQQVFSFHHISKEEFQKSFDYYQSHPKLMKDIMDSLSKPLTAVPADTIKKTPLPDTMRRVNPDTARHRTDTMPRPGVIKSLPIN
jgi:hypothetical protein